MILNNIRLGLLEDDLADRFSIFVSYVSRIFTTWVKVLRKFLGEHVFNPPKEVVRANLPPPHSKPQDTPLFDTSLIALRFS